LKDISISDIYSSVVKYVEQSTGSEPNGRVLPVYITTQYLSLSYAVHNLTHCFLNMCLYFCSIYIMVFTSCRAQNFVFSIRPMPTTSSTIP